MRHLILFSLRLIIQCNQTADIEICFSTMVNGSVSVNCMIDKMAVPCGDFSAFNGPETNEGFDFDTVKDLCGASASGYHAFPPDSAFLDWGFVAEGKEEIPENVQFYENISAFIGFTAV